MPLDPKDGIGSYIKDFKKSKAPQFKGKSEKKRRDMAIAAYLDAKRGPQEAKLTGSTLKLFGQKNRDGSKPELNRDKPTFEKIRKKVNQKKDIKEGSYKVSIAGLPDMYMDDKTPGALLQKLRKIVKQPSMIKDVERTTTAKKRKDFRQKAQGREVAEYKYDYGTPESVKLMKKQTPGQNEGTDAPKGPESYEAQYKRRLVKTTDPEHKAKGFKYRIKGKKDSSLTKKLYKTKPGQAEFNKQMKRIAGHEFG
tara:strand:+ start:180 stop:935 length:756 start_codon:yes stop_codon:yes gene_type:complete